MKRLLPIALCIVPLLSLAGNATPDACGGTAKVAVPMHDDAAMVFQCAPSNLGGSGSLWQFAHQNGGIVAWNYCNDGFSYTWQIGVMKDALLTDQSIYADWLVVEFAADKAAAMDNFRRRHISISLMDPSMTPIWCPSIKGIIAGTPPPIPYVVMPNADPAKTTQLVYTVSAVRDGVRSTSPFGTVPVKRSDGTPYRCNCLTSRVVEGSQAYCNIGSKPLQVTACVKQ